MAEFKADVLVLGAGMVGVGAALHLQQRGRDVILVDREEQAGEGTSLARRHAGLWFDFGHQHHGLTLGPATGRLLAEMMTGETPVRRSRAVCRRAVRLTIPAECGAGMRSRPLRSLAQRTRTLRYCDKLSKRSQEPP
jgi:glycine/D-amino acid oxidase-like deaminating enzyme